MLSPSDRPDSAAGSRDGAFEALLRENARLEIAELEGRLLARNQERLMDFVQRVTSRLDDDDLMDVIVEEFLGELKVDRVSYVLMGEGEKASWAVSHEAAVAGVKRLAIPYFVARDPDSDFIRFLERARSRTDESTSDDWPNAAVIQPERNFPVDDVEEEFQAALEEEFGLARSVECRTAMAFPIETTLGGPSLFVVQRVKGETGFTRYHRDLFMRMCRYAASLLEQRQLSEQVSDLKDQFSSLIESMPSGIIGMDLLGTVTSWNGKAAEWFGISPDEALGQVFWELVPEFRFVSEALRDALQVPVTGRDFEPFAFERSGRPRIWLRANLFTMFGRDRGEVALRVDDVTRTVDLHNQLFQAQRMEVVGTLAGGLSRQLGDLMASLVASTGLLRQKAEGEFFAHDLDLLEESASRAAAVVEDIQTLAHGPEGDPEVFDIGNMVRQLVKLCKRAFEPRVQLVAKVSDAPAPVCGDRSRVEQAVLNICLNAREAMAGGGILAIEMNLVNEDAATWACLTIGDTGPGIDKETLSHIFNPYFTTKGQSGSGLGLAIVEAVMQQHHGRIQVESQPGRGTTFRLWFPLSSKAQMMPAAQAPLPAGQGDLLLIVHEEMLRRTSVRVLEELGYTVTPLPDGASALRLIDKGLVFDLVIVDVELPVLNGVTTVELLRRAHPALPVILCAGRTKVEGLDALLNEPDITELRKPFGMPQLAHAVKQALAPDIGI
jgi:two-component system, cell cycle sensor histidine kinase and response regulator CckA